MMPNTQTMQRNFQLLTAETCQQTFVMAHISSYAEINADNLKVKIFMANFFISFKTHIKF